MGIAQIAADGLNAARRKLLGGQRTGNTGRRRAPTSRRAGAWLRSSPERRFRPGSTSAVQQAEGAACQSVTPTNGARAIARGRAAARGR